MKKTPKAKNSSRESQADTEYLQTDVLAALWEKVRPNMDIGTDQTIKNALSGDDTNAAKVYICWLHDALQSGEKVNEETRSYAVAALAKYRKGADQVTLGQAFGVERASGKPGGPPNRAGGKQAVIRLIGCLNKDHGYPLGESTTKPSAFEVASQLLAAYMRFNRKPNTLRDTFWKTRPKQ